MVDKIDLYTGIMVGVIILMIIFIEVVGKNSEGRLCVDNGGVYNITNKTCEK